jgi:hypothetical protein
MVCDNDYITKLIAGICTGASYNQTQSYQWTIVCALMYVYSRLKALQMHFDLYLDQSSCRIATIREQHLQLMLQPGKMSPSLQHRRRTRNRHRRHRPRYGIARQNFPPRFSRDNLFLQWPTPVVTSYYFYFAARLKPLVDRCFFRNTLNTTH